MDESALYEWLAGAEAQNPGALQQMIDAGLFGDRAALAGQDMAQGAAMMNAPGAQGMRVGGTYVASSPLEHASVALERAMGASRMNDARQSQDQLVGQKGTGMEALIRAMAKRGQPAQTQMGIPPGLPAEQPAPGVPGYFPAPY